MALKATKTPPTTPVPPVHCLTFPTGLEGMDPEFRESCEAQERARRGIYPKPQAEPDPQRFFDTKADRFPEPHDDGFHIPPPGQYEVATTLGADRKPVLKFTILLLHPLSIR